MEITTIDDYGVVKLDLTYIELYQIAALLRKPSDTNAGLLAQEALSAFFSTAATLASTYSETARLEKQPGGIRCHINEGILCEYADIPSDLYNNPKGSQ